MNSNVEKKGSKYLLSISKTDFEDSELIFGFGATKKELRDLYLQLREIFTNETDKK
jgi:hypothetical protein